MDAEEMPFPRLNGISVVTGTCFVVGEVVGAGIVALPYTMKLVSWWGIPLFFLGAFIMSLCGVLLSHSYVLAFRDVKNREEIRDPYPQIAEKAYGKPAKHCIIIMLNLSLLFVCVVFLLLLGEIFSEFAPIHGLSHRNQMRIWFVVSSFVLIPLTMFGTPKDFWGIGLLASICSAIAGVMICLNLAITSSRYGYTVPHRYRINPETALAVFGTISFTFGGNAIFPTIQNDLREPHKFPRAVVFGYCVVLVLYTGVSIGAFLVFDTRIEEDLLTSFARSEIHDKCIYFRVYTMLAQISICGHLLAAFVIIINPVNQQVEYILKSPVEFCWQRVVLRTICVMVILITAVAIPNFGPVLSLLGGSFFTLLSVVFPIIFYNKLKEGQLALWKKFGLLAIMCITVSSAIGNFYVESKNIFKVIKGSYET
ncbi:uncharacterized protein [Clytia hemisphaerica]|uniref:Amino acid transporter transmembrane domain-containing protein n=1 Tax=Clytia hemisphaerica TaxID=252671 RepID=A0A7M6DLW8_9CNID|eukprot:TCONS_00002702-protein